MKRQWKMFAALACLAALCLALAGCGGSGGGSALDEDTLSGDWYGWYVITNPSESNESFDNYRADLCVRISFDEDGSGIMSIWSEYAYKSSTSLFGEVPLMQKSGNTAVSVDGRFGEAYLVGDEWEVENKNDLIAIKGTMKNEFGSYDYAIQLRPWGDTWDDITDDQLPHRYKDWYLPLVEVGSLMPDEFGGAAVFPPPEEAEPENTEAEGSGNEGGNENVDSGPVELGDGSGLTVMVPSGYSYNDGWLCWSNAAYTMMLQLNDTRTYATLEEMNSALSSKSPMTRR